MKINPDCVRDLMLYLEEKTKTELIDIAGHKTLGFHQFSPALLCKVEGFEKYDYSELVYHVLQLSESGYIVTDFRFDPKSNSPKFSLTAIYYLTPKGHEFVAQIKDQNTWSNKIKPIVTAFGSISLSVIEAIANGVSTALLNKLIAPQS